MTSKSSLSKIVEKLSGGYATIGGDSKKEDKDRPSIRAALETYDFASDEFGSILKRVVPSDVFVKWYDVRKASDEERQAWQEKYLKKYIEEERQEEEKKKAVAAAARAKEENYSYWSRRSINERTAFQKVFIYCDKDTSEPRLTLSKQYAKDHADSEGYEEAYAIFSGNDPVYVTYKEPKISI